MPSSADQASRLGAAALADTWPLWVWHRVICWNKLGAWAGALQKGAYVEVEGELRYREFTTAESDRSVRVAEIYANSILALDRSDKQPTGEAVDAELGDEPAD
jgi:single-strand DNA-binding protein